MDAYWQTTLESYYFEGTEHVTEDQTILVPTLAQIPPQSYQKLMPPRQAWTLPSKGDSVVLDEDKMFPAKVVDIIWNYPEDKVTFILETCVVRAAPALMGSTVSKKDFESEKNQAATAMWDNHDYMLKLGFERVTE